MCVSSLAQADLFTEWNDFPHSKVRLGGIIEGKSNQKYALFDIKLEDGWKIYWREAGDAGFPTAIKLLGDDVKKQELLWPYPKRSVAEQFGIRLESYVYENNVTFPIKVVFKEGTQPSLLNVDVEYGICKEICIPVQASLQKNVALQNLDSNSLETLTAALSKIPANINNSGFEVIADSLEFTKDSGGLKFATTIKSDAGFSSDADIFIESKSTLFFVNPKYELIGNSRHYVFDVVSNDEVKAGESLPLTFTIVNQDKAIETTVSYVGEFPEMPLDETEPQLAGGTAIANSMLIVPSQPALTYNIALILLFAFIGGLILNVMPCVLPVLSIKLLGILNHQDDFKVSTARISFLCAAAGIIVSFVVLALLVIILRYLGVSVGWGFHFQQPYFIVIMVLILTFFACNLWGLFEIKMTSLLSNKLSSASAKSGQMGHFLTGVLATLLATPCTAPFLGTAVGFALAQNGFYIILVFLSMGLGMAMPYFILIYKPTLIKYLPKPGRWMVGVKMLMGVLLMLTAAWLVWVSAAQLGEVGAKALGLIVVLIIINLIPAIWNNEKMRAIIIVSFVIWALMLPTNFSNQAVINKEGAESLNELWKSLDVNKIQQYLADDKIVFVDITADWCLTCKFNELWAFNNDAVQMRLKSDDVVAMRGDWTNRDDAILSYLQSHGRQGIPFNVVYSKDNPTGIVLPELLTETIILESLDK